MSDQNPVLHVNHATVGTVIDQEVIIIVPGAGDECGRGAGQLVPLAQGGIVPGRAPAARADAVRQLTRLPAPCCPTP